MKNSLGPATASSQHVTIGEAAANGKPNKVFERDAAGQKIGHVHVIGFKTSTSEGCRHLGLRIDALLTQHGKLGTHARCNVRSRDAFVVIKRGLHKQALDILVAHPVGFAVGAYRIVAVAGDGV